MSVEESSEFEKSVFVRSKLVLLAVRNNSSKPSYLQTMNTRSEGKALSPKSSVQSVLEDIAFEANRELHARLEREQHATLEAEILEKTREAEIAAGATENTVLPAMTTQVNTEANTTFVGDDLAMTTQANTTFVADEAAMRTDDLAMATQASSIPRSDLVKAQKETCFICPVCLQPLGSVPATANVFEPWTDDLRAVRKHCAKRHPDEYLWNVCNKEESTKIPLSVSGLITSAFRTAATQLPLPENPEFTHSWCRVRMVMCARLCLAYRILNNGRSIAQLISRKRDALKKWFPTDSKDQASQRRIAHGSDAMSLKSLAMTYVQLLLWKVEISEAPDAIQSQFPPRNWNDYSSWRKMNLIQLFFWNGKHHREIELIYDLPPTVEQLISGEQHQWTGL